MITIFLIICVACASASTTIKPEDSTGTTQKVETTTHIEHHETTRLVKIQEGHMKGSSIFNHGHHHDISAGTILTPTWILTTAHNLEDVSGKNLRVVYAAAPHHPHTLFPKLLPEISTIRAVKNQFLHPDWVKGTKTLPAENNIALLELEKPLELAKDFKPFYLESLDDEEDEDLPKHVAKISFYEDQAGTPVEKLKTFLDSPCKNHPLNVTFLEEKVCAHICSNLTGSPLWEQKDQEHAILFGIVQAEVLPCGKAPFTFYTSVAPYLRNFIKGHLKNETLHFVTQ